MNRGGHLSDREPIETRTCYFLPPTRDAHDSRVLTIPALVWRHLRTRTKSQVVNVEGLRSWKPRGTVPCRLETRRDSKCLVACASICVCALARVGRIGALLNPHAHCTSLLRLSHYFDNAERHARVSTIDSRRIAKQGNNERCEMLRL